MWSHNPGFIIGTTYAKKLLILPELRLLNKFKNNQLNKCNVRPYLTMLKFVKFTLTLDIALCFLIIG